MIKTEYLGDIVIGIWEYCLIPVYLIIIYAISSWIQNRNIDKNPAYRYYTRGVLLKVLCGLVLCFIYVFYYNGGDTTTYYESAYAMVNLFYERPYDFFVVLFNPVSEETYSLFTHQTGYPLRYLWFDTQTGTVVRIISPLLILGCKSYLLSTMLLAWASYSGIWRLYLLFCRYYSSLSKPLAIAILFIPSVAFWGSGILKDTITLSASCWFVYAVYKMCVQKESFLRFAVVMLLAAWALILIKPYILIALLPGTIIWIMYERVVKIRNNTLRMLAMPSIYILSIAIGFLILTLMGDALSSFSIDKLLMKAVVTQQDLKSSNYGPNSFDIGEFDPSFWGIASKAPLAITAGLFRPFIWESNNIVMLLSGLENAFILGLVIMLVFRIKITRFFKIMGKNPLLIFSLSYAILFAFSIGLTTANFGALVRFKIPLIPFFVSSLFILSYFMKNKGTETVAEPVKKQGAFKRKVVPLSKAAVPSSRQ